MSALDFDQMLISNTDFLKPFAFTLTRDNEAAKDLIQETLFRALANRDKYNVGTNIKAWLYTICLLYTSPSPRDRTRSRMPSSA